MGMELLNPNWKDDDPPYELSDVFCNCGSEKTCRLKTAKPGSLRWYQARHCCHWIAPFSMAIGILNYPHLDWRFVTGERHTVPVGFNNDGEPIVVMDILCFDVLNAQTSISFAAMPPLTFNDIFNADTGQMMHAFEATLIPELYQVARMAKGEKPSASMAPLLGSVKPTLPQLKTRKAA